MPTAVDALGCRATGRGVRIDLRVMPRASKNAIEGVRAGRLVVRVTAPPVDSAANDAVIAVLARALDVPRGQVALVAGLGARNKTAAIDGLDAAAVRQRLSAILG